MAGLVLLPLGTFRQSYTDSALAAFVSISKVIDNITADLWCNADCTVEEGYAADISASLQLVRLYFLIDRLLVSNTEVTDSRAVVVRNIMPYIHTITTFNSKLAGYEYCGGTGMTVAQLVAEGNSYRAFADFYARVLNLYVVNGTARADSASGSLYLDAVSKAIPDYDGDDNDLSRALCQSYIDSIREVAPVVASGLNTWIETSGQFVSATASSQAFSQALTVWFSDQINIITNID